MGSMLGDRKPISWANVRKTWLKPDVYPIIACVAGAVGLVVYRLWKASQANEVQIVARQERTMHLENIIRSRD